MELGEAGLERAADHRGNLRLVGERERRGVDAEDLVVADVEIDRHGDADAVGVVGADLKEMDGKEVPTVT